MGDLSISSAVMVVPSRVGIVTIGLIIMSNVRLSRVHKMTQNANSSKLYTRYILIILGHINF